MSFHLSRLRRRPQAFGLKDVLLRKSFGGLSPEALAKGDECEEKAAKAVSH